MHLACVRCDVDGWFLQCCVANVQSFGSRDQLSGEACVRHDLDQLTSMTAAGIEAKKTHQVKLCSVSHTHFQQHVIHVSLIYTESGTDRHLGTPKHVKNGCMCLNVVYTGSIDVLYWQTDIYFELFIKWL